MQFWFTFFYLLVNLFLLLVLALPVHLALPLKRTSLNKLKESFECGQKYFQQSIEKSHLSETLTGGPCCPIGPLNPGRPTWPWEGENITYCCTGNSGCHAQWATDFLVKPILGGARGAQIHWHDLDKVWSDLQDQTHWRFYSLHSLLQAASGNYILFKHFCTSVSTDLVHSFIPMSICITV